MRTKGQTLNFKFLLMIISLILVNACKNEEPLNLPIVTTELTLSKITASEATSGGTITNDNGETVTSRGVCWSTHIDPTIKDSLSKDGSGAGSFTSNLKNLVQGTTYYLRAYATNKSGTAYGNAISFVTLDGIINQTTSLVTNIYASSANSGGNITNDGGAPVTMRGICWSVNPNPTVSDNKTLDGSGVGSFSSSITNLTPATKYYVRVYATNRINTYYGNEQVFTTKDGKIQITTSVIRLITETTASTGGNITNDGGSSVTDRGVCWSTTTSPTIQNNKVSNNSGIGSFTSSVNGLAYGTKYYVRAFATNNFGTAYGNEVYITAGMQIGSFYAGGIVFYNDGTGHGLVCAESNQASSIPWYNGSYLITSATETAIGTGESNTNRIVSIQGNGSYAAKICYDLVLNNYSDWFLPSKDELSLMRTNLYKYDPSKSSDIGPGHFPLAQGYWSSSEGDINNAWYMSFYSLDQSRINKNYTDYVRAIRKF